MVNHKQLKQKSGIAMIELIFALVIMGIVLMSAPMLIQQSIKSGNVALQQEAIVAAASQTAIVLSMHWDENNDSNLAGVSSILDVNRLPFDFTALTPPVGIVGVTGRSSTRDGATRPESNSSTFGNIDAGETEFDDVDDYDKSELNLTVFDEQFTTATKGDYVDTDINITTLINYTEDRITTGNVATLSNASGRLVLDNKINTNPIGTSTNIKFIQVNLTSNKNNDPTLTEYHKNITFQAFSCNIGTTSSGGADKL